MKRIKKSFRFVVSLLLVFTLLVPELAPAFAADWNGSSADSSVGNVDTKVSSIQDYIWM